MNTSIYIVNTDYIKQNSTISDNLNDNILLPVIKDAQLTKLMAILGEVLYDKVCSVVEENNQTLYPDYQHLINNYIKMYLLYEVQATLSITNYQHQHNAGSVQYVDTNYSNIQLNEVKYFRQYWENKASFYGEMLKNYLDSNRHLFPEYRKTEKGKLDSSDTANVYFAGLSLKK
jgi:hypothetical protein